MKVRTVTAALATAFVFASSASAQDDVEARFKKAQEVEQAEIAKVRAQLDELDEKIRKFNECKELFEAAGDASGKKLGGLAAKVAIKAKCGATSVDGYLKDRRKLLEQPEKLAAAAGGFKLSEYASLKERFAAGPAGAGAASKASGRGGRMRGAMAGAWTMDLAWQHIGEMLGLMYMSGSTMLEKPYTPGQWTRWQIRQASSPDEQLELERAFIARTSDGNEWWRMKTVQTYKDDDGKAVADTVVMEALLKPMGEYVQQMVRARGRMPGDKEARELLVPQGLATLSSLAALPFKPTPESLQGATVGTESVGKYSAKHVKFAAGNGALEWWLADDAPGGLVRFRHTSDEKDDEWTMEMVNAGSGAKSELGVI